MAVDNAFDMFSYSSDLKPVNPAPRAERSGADGGGSLKRINTITSVSVHYPTYKDSLHDSLLGSCPGQANHDNPTVLSET